MSVDHSPMLYVGQEFESQYEAQSFYEQYFDLSEEDKEYIEENGFSEYMYSQEELSGSILNYYTGYGFVLGIDLSYPKPDTFKQDYEDAVTTWKKYFKDEPFDIIHTVCVS